MVTGLAIALLVGYFLGALPFGYLVARANGVDIFSVGSGSPGATNVKRSVSPGAGNLVFALDALKGAVASGWLLVVPVAVSAGRETESQIAGLAGALLGHSYSCFTRFRGGKGVATGAGGLLVLAPVATLVAAVVWIGTFYASRYVSLASILAAVVLPIAAWLLGGAPLLIGFTSLVGLFVVIRHRANLRRLLDGTENKFVRRSERKDPP